MPSPLAAIYSSADSFKRGLLDAVQNPVDKMRQVIGNANDRAGVLNTLTGQAADQTVASIKSGGPAFPDTPESQQLTQMMADAYNPVGMMVYHGSPYKFNAFAPKAIGSGEGAQAYGYGHYVAESPDVAKDYAAKLGEFRVEFDGEMSNPIAKEIADAVYQRARVAPYQERYGVAMDAMQNIADPIRDRIVGNSYMGIKPMNDQGLMRMNVAKKMGQPKIVSEGNLYKLDIPDEQIDKMLDWDAEISKQTPEVQALAKQFGLASDDLGGDLVAAMNAKLPEGAESMRSAGVPGIKYFDGQSRGGKKADTRNFVVFPQNEGLLKILERNGVPLE